MTFPTIRPEISPCPTFAFSLISEGNSGGGENMQKMKSAMAEGKWARLLAGILSWIFLLFAIGIVGKNNTYLLMSLICFLWIATIAILYCLNSLYKDKQKEERGRSALRLFVIFVTGFHLILIVLTVVLNVFLSDLVRLIKHIRVLWL